MDIWCYWEGKRPPNVERCIARFRDMYGSRYRLVTEWPKEFGPRPDTDVNMVADLFKFETLYRYGGHCCDADCVPFRDFDLLAESHPEELVTILDGWSCDLGYIAAKRDKLDVVGCLREMAYAKLRWGQLKEWTALSKRLLITIETNPIPTNDCIMPVHWRESSKFIATGSHEQHLANFNDSAYCYMLTRGQMLWSCPQDCFLEWLLQHSESGGDVSGVQRSRTARSI